MTGATALRVLIVDDQAVVRLGFTSLLDSQPDLTVVGVAADGREAVRLAGQLAPDIVLMDIRMPVLGGIDATRLLQDNPDPPKILILTTFDLDDYVYDALRAGASGFLLKDATPEQILEAVRVLGAGDALLADLTPREYEVFSLVARGLANAEIARSLHLAEQTVKTHVSAMLSKLGLRDRVQAVILAYESGIVIPGGSAAVRPDQKTSG
jgi:DNA-binding NarL/FixJ family response regulator